MINSYDIDGVINLGEYVGLRPGQQDIIITGRSEFDELAYTREWLNGRGIYNMLFMNKVKFEDKTRESSGHFKAATINKFWDLGVHIGIHFEDDPIQADIIEREAPRVKVVRIVHDLVEKENVWHGDTKHTGSTEPKL